MTVSGATGNIPSPFVMNPGRWAVTIKIEQNLFLVSFAVGNRLRYEFDHRTHDQSVLMVFAGLLRVFAGRVLRRRHPRGQSVEPLRHRQHRRRSVQTFRLSEYRQIRPGQEHFRDDFERRAASGLLRRLKSKYTRTMYPPGRHECFEKKPVSFSPSN